MLDKSILEFSFKADFWNLLENRVIIYSPNASGY